MSDQKKFASYALIAIGSAELIAGIVALKYCSNLSPLIAGGIIGSTPLLIACVGFGVLLLMDKISLDKIYGDTYDQNSFSKLVISAIAHVGISFGIGAGLVALDLKSPLIIAVLTPIACKVIMLLFSAITERSSSPPRPPCVDSNMKTDGANPTDHPERREYDGKRTERKCKTYATRKKPIIVTDEDKEDHISKEQQLVQSLEDHFKRIANLKIEIPGNADDVNKCSFPSH
ncbi:MAG: hypothetical protein ACR5K6_05605 [Wolbachia sp.]